MALLPVFVNKVCLKITTPIISSSCFGDRTAKLRGVAETVWIPKLKPFLPGPLWKTLADFGSRPIPALNSPGRCYWSRGGLLASTGQSD